MTDKKIDLKKTLTPLQYKVTQEEGTEPPFKNEYWDNKEPGIYVDIVSGEPLFSSTHKFKSGTGWPSFTQPIEKDRIVYKEDRHFFSTRTEVRSKEGDSHLGHVFDDGPAPTGKRYCINSAALKFIAVKDLKEKGYEKFIPLFENQSPPSALSVATFGGGCFWCMEPPFENEPGVTKVISGYMGGHQNNPTYEQVSSGTSGHLEVVQVHYDPKVISYDKLLDIFWKNIDPTDSEGQFVDKGSQYKSAIFTHDEQQVKTAEASKKQLAQSGVFKKPIVTTIQKAQTFYAAEDYHQDYYKKNPVRYKFYRYNSGRDAFIKGHWKK